MAKVIIKELDYSSGTLTPDEIEVLELVADQADAYLDNDLEDLFRQLEKQIQKFHMDPQ